MGIKINGVEPLCVVDSINNVHGRTITSKKAQKRPPDIFEKKTSAPSPFLRAQNSLKNDALLPIESRDLDPLARWWTDELALLAPECISENSYIKPQIADQLKIRAQEKDYLIVNLADMME